MLCSGSARNGLLRTSQDVELLLQNDLGGIRFLLQKWIVTTAGDLSTEMDHFLAAAIAYPQVCVGHYL